MSIHSVFMDGLLLSWLWELQLLYHKRDIDNRILCFLVIFLVEFLWNFIPNEMKQNGCANWLNKILLC